MPCIPPQPALRLRHLLSAAWLTSVLGIVLPAHALQDMAAERAVASVQATATAEQAMPQPVQPPSSSVPAATLPAASTAPSRQIQIGQATTQLLDLQRASKGQRPRPIEGEQASRSYLRYLKSFESTIPDHYGTGLNTGAGAR